MESKLKIGDIIQIEESSYVHHSYVDMAKTLNLTNFTKGRSPNKKEYLASFTIVNIVFVKDFAATRDKLTGKFEMFDSYIYGVRSNVSSNEYVYVERCLSYNHYLV